jgi:cyclophilin family peptidyl-prolyl cis-trans isomerase
MICRNLANNNPFFRVDRFAHWRWCLFLGFFGSVVPIIAGPKVLPVLNRPIADRSGLAGFPLTVNLASAFGTEAIDDQVVRFTSRFSSGEIPVVMDMALFSNRTPVTRQNFLNYVASGAYVDSFIHRSVPGFVIQGGASRIVSGAIQPIPTNPPILNEFGISNTLGTVSMAKLGGDPNSATSQWFVSLGANSNILDPQNGGFTVFGRMTRNTFGNAQTFGNPQVFPIFSYSGISTELPLFQSHVPPNLRIDEFILFPGVALVPLPVGEAGEDTQLTYSVVSNTNLGLVSTSINPEGQLTLSPTAGAAGDSTLTIRATDSVGNTVDDQFVLNVNLTDTYTTWASRNSFPNGLAAPTQNPDGDAWNNLQEFAFLGDPALPSPSGAVVFAGFSGAAPAARYLTLTFPVRKFTQGLTYAVESNGGLAGGWTEIWKSSDGFSHSQVVTALDQADRTVVTVRDTAALEGVPERFLRVRVGNL